MVVLLYFFIVIINLLFTFARKKSKLVQVITCLYIILLYVGSRDTFDIVSYISMYEDERLISLRGIQYLFYLFMDIGKSLNFSFYEFRAALSFVSLLLISFFFSKTSINPHIAYIGYLIYPVFMHDIQIRDFVACSYFYVGLYFLLKGGANWKFKYIIFLILSILNHYLFVFYVVLLILKFDLVKEKRFYRAFFPIVAVLSVVLIFNQSYLYNLKSIMFIIDPDKAEVYSEDHTRYGALVFVVYQAWILYILSYLYVRVKKMKLSNNLSILKPDVYFNLLLVNVITSAIIPMIVIDFNFYRMLRSLVIVNFIFVTNYLYFVKDIRLMVGLLLYYFMWVYIDISGSNFERVTTIFNNNTLIW